MTRFLAEAGLTLVERRAGQFSEAYLNLPGRPLKRMVYRLNELCFRLNFWPGLAQGNILIFRKGNGN